MKNYYSAPPIYVRRHNLSALAVAVKKVTDNGYILNGGPMFDPRPYNVSATSEDGEEVVKTLNGCYVQSVVKLACPMDDEVLEVMPVDPKPVDPTPPPEPKE